MLKSLLAMGALMAIALPAAASARHTPPTYVYPTTATAGPPTPSNWYQKGLPAPIENPIGVVWCWSASDPLLGPLPPGLKYC